MPQRLIKNFSRNNIEKRQSISFDKQNNKNSGNLVMVGNNDIAI